MLGSSLLIYNPSPGVKCDCWKLILFQKIEKKMKKKKKKKKKCPGLQKGKKGKWKLPFWLKKLSVTQKNSKKATKESNLTRC